MSTSLKRLQGRVALVTGGAAGIGAAAVRQWVEEGARVTFTDLNRDAGEALARDLGDACRFVQGNHTAEADNQAAVDATLQAFGQLDILYNNAGTIAQGGIGDMKAMRIEEVLRVNLLGPFLMVQAALPALRARARVRQCAILFTASVQSLIARPGYTAYGASKHGIGGLVGSLALELAPENIRVNAVCPGPVDTRLFRDGTRHIASDPAEVASKYMAGVPMGRFVEPQEVAQAASFLVSDQASAITGAMLPVDGGITAR
ncbi:SDR family NAD(P)-dependent oxidoreductase [Hydrogenophaga sp.]|jgi:NAD(P)-dependent dehydrogenase (short-subunit alcohol dehydrogenase family)|uniref:SDR family NAD(P)-dependent oxidoreductase n=1 Tax=Hydrogenophaga sp. TaxID=1904254 RepID=UPI003F709B38